MAIHRSVWVGASALLMVCAAGAAEPMHRDTLTLNASASVEVTQDMLAVAFSTSRDGPDAASVQSGLKLALETALVEARKVAKPGQIEVQTGNFSIYPRYSNKGVISAWVGSAELLVEGRDIAGIAQLTGRIASMSVARVGYKLSREQRERTEGEVAAQAVARYRAKAAELSRLFGYNGFSIGEVNVSGDEPMRYMAADAPRAMRMSAGAEQALPTEAGKATVSVNVSGSVLMTR